MDIQEFKPSPIHSRAAVQDTNGNPFGFSLASETRREFVVSLDLAGVEYLLAHMHPNQRSIVTRTVADHLARMKARSFVDFMHPGIYVDRPGWVCNANHRLLAYQQYLTEEDEPREYRWAMVIGASKEEIAALDQTRSRRPHQSYNLTIAGHERMTSREEATIRQYIRLQHSDDDGLAFYYVRLGPDDLAEFRQGPFYKDVAYVIEKVPTRVASAPALASIAYARPISPQTVDGFLRGFVESRLAIPTTQSKHAPPVTLARWFNTNGGSGAGGRYVDSVLNRTLTALRAHLQGRELSYLPSGGGALAYLKQRRQELDLEG